MHQQVNRKCNPVARAMAGESVQRHAGPHGPSAKDVRRISRAELRQFVCDLVNGKWDCDVERH